MTTQPTNVSDAAIGNVAAARHIAYAEGYAAGKKAAKDGTRMSDECVQCVYGPKPAQAEPAAIPAGYKLLKDTTQDERSWLEDGNDENGCYYNTCAHCGRGFTGHKRRGVCKVCANEAPAAQPQPVNAGMVDALLPFVKHNSSDDFITILVSRADVAAARSALAAADAAQPVALTDEQIKKVIYRHTNVVAPFIRDVAREAIAEFCRINGINGIQAAKGE